jgi:hypothetical protein
MQCKTFIILVNTGDNLGNNSSINRLYTKIMPNTMGESYAGYPGNQIVFQAYLAGFKLLPSANGVFVSVNASILNETHFTLNISTIGTITLT